MAVHRQGECWISRRYKRALTGTANGGRHKAMPCQAEEVLKAPVGQPAFQQLNGATALYSTGPGVVIRETRRNYYNYSGEPSWEGWSKILPASACSQRRWGIADGPCPHLSAV